jgi:VanZ family protein
MKRSFLILILILIWIGLVFYFSSQPPDVSGRQSGNVYKFLKKVDNVLDFTQTRWYRNLRSLLEKWWFPDKKPTGEDLVRKSAHFGLYFIMGILSFTFSYTYLRKYVFSILMGVSLPTLIAVLDEYNQSFRGRGASLYDVIVDMNGAVIGTVLIFLFLLTLKLFKRRGLRRRIL